MTGLRRHPMVDAEELDADLLTRTEASAYLARYNVRMKPATLARIWSVGQDGPPCQHIRRKPFYPRGELRAWALRQRTALRPSRTSIVLVQAEEL
ncbi:hypothetical protein [Phenylobacterium sp.]|jgi:hypothetical protein|uniref:hypothetical protein n=1 Tax=Phenylobacterium sp. TaxID=1871053 RepID=UPI003BAD0A32